MEKYINIKEIAETIGLKSNKSLRIGIKKGKYIAREISVKGGKTYEILYSSLEPEIQEKLEDKELKSTALIPIENNNISFISEKSKLVALAKVDILKALESYRNKYKTKKEADDIFLNLYNSEMLLPQIYKYIGKISRSTLRRWLKDYEESGIKALYPQYKCVKQGEYNTSLNKEMQQIFLKYLLNPRKFSIEKATCYTKHILKKRGYEYLPCNLTFRRFAIFFKKNNYALWVISRKGEKAYHDEVEAYIKRDISKINVGDVLVADGHVLNFLVKNPFTGKPTRATLVGFLDWKSTALVGYEIMMTENTQCIASALRNSILNLGVIPKIVYQDNGKAFKAKYFQNIDFDEVGFNGVYSNLGIKSVFAKPYNARAKVIERFFREFQEGFEKIMPSYIGTNIENKPAWLKRGEKVHKELHKNLTGNYIPTVNEVITCLNAWLDFYNSNICPNEKTMTIKECLNTVQKEHINKNILNDLMLKTETKTITKHGITFLGLQYRNDLLLDLRDSVFIRYSLFDLSKVLVYSKKGEFLCVAHQVEKVHPMANHLGTVKDMEQFKQTIQRQKRQFNRVIKELKSFYPTDDIDFIEIKKEEPIIELEPVETEKTTLKHKLTAREQQMNRPFFETNYEKFEWLMKNGCTNQEDRKFLASYIRSDEYIEIFSD